MQIYSVDAIAASADGFPRHEKHHKNSLVAF